jgi:ribosomal protein L16 Arg81 hydroxylase
MKPGLAALLAPKSVDEFMAKAWPTEPFLVHGDPRRLRGLADVKELASVEALAKLPCRALLAQGQHLDTNHFGNIAVAPEVAPSLLRAGVTLYFNQPEFRSRSLWRWVRTIERELGLGAGSISPSVFFSGRGKGARMHFDSSESFVVQLKGRKEWRIARNTQVPFPPVNYLERGVVPDELAPWMKRPVKAPTKVRKIVLKPGSVLYLPRGWWHATQTLEDSVHLDLLTGIPTWADLFRVELERIFARGMHWLTPATAREFGPAMVRKLFEELSDEGSQ